MVTRADAVVMEWTASGGDALQGVLAALRLPLWGILGLRERQGSTAPLLANSQA